MDVHAQENATTRFIIDDSLESLENVTHIILSRIAAEIRPRFDAKSLQLRRIPVTTIEFGSGEDVRQFDSCSHNLCSSRRESSDDQGISDRGRVISDIELTCVVPSNLRGFSGMIDEND